MRKTFVFYHTKKRSLKSPLRLDYWHLGESLFAGIHEFDLVSCGEAKEMAAELLGKAEDIIEEILLDENHPKRPEMLERVRHIEKGLCDNIEADDPKETPCTFCEEVKAQQEQERLERRAEVEREHREELSELHRLRALVEGIMVRIDELEEKLKN